MTGFRIIAPGILSLIQDAGRFGHHQIGLTTGGPIDAQAFLWANRLCQNDHNSSCIEITIGGLTLEAETDTQIAVTGAQIPLKINGQSCELWETHSVQAGDKISFGFSSDKGCRAYLAVAGGFEITPQFDSSATVVRESIGGLNGQALKKGDWLPCAEHKPETHYSLAPQHHPVYQNEAVLRVIPGYQQRHFSTVKQRLFYSSEYRLSELCDRMGFRLEGPKVGANIDGILSEGICFGAIQVPADGQPIVLMNDRQTIGGYPKIGSVLSLDMAKLGQLTPGSTVRFEPIDIDQAQQAILLEHRRLESIQLDLKN